MTLPPHPRAALPRTPAWRQASYSDRAKSGGPISEAFVAQAGMFVLGLWYPLGSGIASSTTLGDLVLLVLIPVWWKGLRSAVGGTLVLALSGIAVASGLLLMEYAKLDHTVVLGDAADTIMLLFGIVAGAGFVLWGRRVTSIARLCVWYGLGLLGQAAKVGVIGFSTTAWKGGLAVAAAITILAAAALVGDARRRVVLEIAGAAVLALTSVMLDSRSYLATFTLTLALVVWQLRPRAMTGRRSWAWVAVFMAALAVGMYQLGTSLLVDGYLGKSAQVRTIEQLRTAGSLILGGRPELGASIALFEHKPSGFGVGVIADSADVRAAKVGLAQLNYDPNNGYVDKFMFGGQIELHSTIGDLWAEYGLAGLALCLTIAFLVLRRMAGAVAERTGTALQYFLCWWTLWNVFFSPALAAAPTMLLVLGTILPIRGAPEAGAPESER